LVAIYHDRQSRLCCDESPASVVTFGSTKTKEKADNTHSRHYRQTVSSADSGSVIDAKTQNEGLIHVEPVSIILQI
jgi:hypothetical protein